MQAHAPGTTGAGTGTGTGTGSGLTPRQQAILDSLDPAYCRSCAIASIDAWCEIPSDFANPQSTRKHMVVDWGKVTKIGVEQGALGDRPVTLNIITLQGQRGTYRFKDDLLVGRLQTQVGALLAICEEEESDFWQLSGGPTHKTRAVATLSGPPRVAEMAKYQAMHIRDLDIAADAVNKRLTLDATKRYLIHAKVAKADGDLFLMDRYWLDPRGMKNAGKLAAKQRFWMIVEKPEFVETAGDKRLVVKGVAVVDDIFP